MLIVYAKDARDRMADAKLRSKLREVEQECQRLGLEAEIELRAPEADGYTRDGGR